MIPIRLGIALLFISLLFSCNSDDDTSGPVEQDPAPVQIDLSDNFGNAITRDFFGRVIDVDRNPISGATVTIGSATTTSDDFGIFSMKDANIFQNFGYVQVSKTGYIHGSRTVIPTEGVNEVTIMLLAETITGTTSSGLTTTITDPSGASVDLQGDYIDNSGNPYSGDVNVIIHHLDPTDPDMEFQMPGMLYAANASNEERLLQTLGMIAVELRGSNGEDLNLAESSTADITIPLDASLLSIAPNSIPLWFFDENRGYWVEDGEAILDGNKYIGTVSHFSFWNCDIPAEAISLCLDVLNNDGLPVANANVQISSAIYGTRNGTTNADGEVCGLVPANESLGIDVFLNEICGAQSLFSGTIGPYSADAAETITINENPDIIYETVVGTFNNCDNMPVQNGYMILNYLTETIYAPVSNGTFEINTFRCNNDDNFTLQGIDIDTFQNSEIIQFIFTTPTTNIGIINACIDLPEFIIYQVDDNPSYIFGPDELGYDLGPPDIFLFGSGFDGANEYGIFIYVPNNVEGAYDLFDGIGLNFEDPINGSYDEDFFSELNLELVNFGEVGETIEIVFNGTYEDNDGVSHTMTGQVRKIREF